MLCWVPKIECNSFTGYGTIIIIITRWYHPFKIDHIHIYQVSSIHAYLSLMLGKCIFTNMRPLKPLQRDQNDHLQSPDGLPFVLCWFGDLQVVRRVRSFKTPNVLLETRCHKRTVSLKPLFLLYLCYTQYAPNLTDHDLLFIDYRYMLATFL